MLANDWVRPMLRTWGAQRRRILTGKRDALHVDGHAPSSVSNYAEKVSRGGKVEQHFAEVYTGDGLEVWRALQHAPYEVREILDLQYVATIDRTAKWRRMDCGKTRFFELLRLAEMWVSIRIEALEARAVQQVPDSVSVQSRY